LYPKFSTAEIEEQNMAVALFLYGSNQPLSLVEHEDFQNMVFTLAPHMKGKLIGRKALATTMLDKVYAQTVARVEGFLQEQVLLLTTCLSIRYFNLIAQGCQQVCSRALSMLCHVSGIILSYGR
jgi:hypothetical protein